MKTTESFSGFLSQYAKPIGYDNIPIEKQWELTYSFLNKPKNREIVKLIIDGTATEVIKKLCQTKIEYIVTIEEALNRKRQLEEIIELERLTKFLDKYQDITALLMEGTSQMKISEVTGLAYATVNKVNKYLQKKEVLLNDSIPKKLPEQTIIIPRVEAQNYLKKYPEVVEYLEEGFSQRKISNLTGMSRNTIKRISNSLKQFPKKVASKENEMELVKIEKLTDQIEEERTKEFRFILEGNLEEWKKSKSYREKMVLQKGVVFSNDDFELIFLDFKFYLEKQKEEIPVEMFNSFIEEVKWKSDHVQGKKGFKSPIIFPFSEDHWNSAFEYYQHEFKKWKNTFLHSYPKKISKTTENKKLRSLTEFLENLPTKHLNEWVCELAMHNLLNSVKKGIDKALKTQKKIRVQERSLLRSKRVSDLHAKSIGKSCFKTNCNSSIKSHNEEKILKMKQQEMVNIWKRRKNSLELQELQIKYLHKFLEAGIDIWSSEWDEEIVPEKFQGVYYKCVSLSEYWLDDRRLIISLRNVKVSKELLPFDKDKACDLLHHLKVFYNLHELDDIYAYENEDVNYPNKQLKLIF